MPNNTNDIAQTAAHIRRIFDESFALPPPEPEQDLVEFALIMAGGNQYAVRMRELAGVAVRRKIVPVPSSIPGVLGVSAVEGQLVPIFELGALLGGGASSAPPQWTALYRAEELIGLAFEEFQGAFRVAPRAVHPIEASSERTQFCAQAIHVDSALIHVLELTSLVSTVSFRQSDRI